MTPKELPTVSNLSAFTKEKDFDTYFTLVTLAPDNCVPSCKDPAKFLSYVNGKFKGTANNGDIRLHMVSVTFGSADLVLVWQAKTAAAAKEFLVDILAGYHCHCNTIHAMWSHGQGG